jgi:hypothetical protein
MLDCTIGASKMGGSIEHWRVIWRPGTLECPAPQVAIVSRPANPLTEPFSDRWQLEFPACDTNGEVLKFQIQVLLAVRRDKAIVAFLQKKISQQQGSALIAIGEAVIADHCFKQGCGLRGDRAPISRIRPVDRRFNSAEVKNSWSATELQRNFVGLQSVIERDPIVPPTGRQGASAPQRTGEQNRAALWRSLPLCARP